MTDLFSQGFERFGLDGLWLLLILVGFPLAVLGLGEIIIRGRRSRAEYTQGVVLLRNVALPLLGLYVLTTQLAGLSTDSTELKILVTLTTIIALVAVLGIVNAVLFSGSHALVTSVPKLFLDIARAVLVAIGIAIVMSSVWDIDLGQLVTALGVSSIVLGLALQDTLGNLFSGITLLYERPFSEGDYIVVGDVDGRVVEVNWRAIRLVTREQNMIVLPHYMVAQSAIINRSQPVVPWAQKLEIGFSYDDAPNRVKDVLFEVLEETPGVLHDPAFEVKTINYNDSSVDYEVEYFIESFRVNEEVRDAFMTRVWYAAKRHGLTIPFPIRTLINQEPKSEEDHSEDLRRVLERAARMLSPRSNPPMEITPVGVRYSHFGIGEQVIPYGKRVSGLYLVIEGEADMFAEDLEGDRANLGHLAAGDFFTEIVLAGMRDNVVEVIAATDLEVLHLTESKIRRLANRDETLARRLDEVNAARRQQVRSLRNELAPLRRQGARAGKDRF